MSAYLEDFTHALRTRIAAAWPDAAAHGIWEEEHAALIPWADLTPPYAAIVIPELPAGDWAADSDWFEGDVEIYYVAEVQGPGGVLRGKLEALRDDLHTNELPTGQVMWTERLSVSRALEPNEIFRAKEMTYRAGRLVARCLVGEASP